MFPPKIAEPARRGILTAWSRLVDDILKWTYTHFPTTVTALTRLLFFNFIFKPLIPVTTFLHHPHSAPQSPHNYGFLRHGDPGKYSYRPC
jgi:hypothetical protein